MSNIAYINNYLMMIGYGSSIEYSKAAFDESYHHLRGNPDNLPKAKPKIKKSSPQPRPVFTPEQVENRLVAVLTPSAPGQAQVGLHVDPRGARHRAQIRVLPRLLQNYALTASRPDKMPHLT